ncbi:hypothetical protein LR48_Vigan09g031600 [Vigna angularis]|uniref:Uncharacterized protein n=2 Tax=Phaseolus angularis TaxID=3914 RepID=A0A0L9V9T8_PHAAN|nr:uncharacterized protein LOC108341161 isoform X1 [Vigna angularis]KAG2400699.1 uncharacterized protein HKW66_Vig0094470 [Vigna angularis]KOM51657.1 hypothetical protein LR48_Vigan09g031600 [Vigna angularis]BAT77690.1 hypothetical protein VIGAN_02028000 [Vigna angularis var. angularis]
MDKGREATPTKMCEFSNAKGQINKQQSQSQSASSWRRNLTPLSSGLNASSEYSEKSKKEKVRSLSAVAKALSMGCCVSHSPKPTKKFKFPRKFPKVGNGVDHASVPRKIRSAVKKRGRESISGDSEKVNHNMNGMESPQKDGIKKSKKQRSPCWSTRQVLPGPITKDEEEVAETLYALAGMLPDNGSNAKSEPDSESLPENSTVLQDQEASQSANVTVEASGATADEGKRSPKGCKKLSSLSETIGHEQTDFPDSANFLVAATQSTVPKVNLQAVSMVKSDSGGRVALHESELSLDMGLNVPIQPQISHIGRKSNVEYQTVGSVDCKQEQHMVKYQKETESPTWWPSLSPTASTGIVASYLQTSAAKTLDWLNTAIGTSRQDLMESCSSGEKTSEIVTQEKKSRKRCASHVHISHLIRSLEVSRGLAGKGHELYESHQARVPEGSNCGVIMEAHNLNWKKSGNSNAAGTVHSATMSNSRETKNGIVQHGLYHDISQAPSTSGVHGPQKQGFNFLSLSTGGNELKVNESFNKGESKLEPYSKSQVPYFQSPQQQHGLMPFQSPYASNFMEHLPLVGPQVRLQQQQPHYYGTPLRGTHYSSTLSYKQQHQSFWAVQLASQGGSSINCSIVRAQYPNWQSGGHDSSVASPCPQVILPHSTASFEALGSKISSISEQQHLFTLASSISRANGQDIHLASSSVCEESKGRLITQQ